MIDYAAIGKRIQKKRQERSITQEKLAEQVGISVVYLSKIENGRVYPTLETLSNICTELDVELAEVLSNTEMERKDYANDRVLSCSTPVRCGSSPLPYRCWKNWPNFETILNFRPCCSFRSVLN